MSIMDTIEDQYEAKLAEKEGAKKQHQCKRCGFPISKEVTYCGECMCEETEVEG